MIAIAPSGFFKSTAVRNKFFCSPILSEHNLSEKVFQYLTTELETWIESCKSLDTYDYIHCSQLISSISRDIRGIREQCREKETHAIVEKRKKTTSRVKLIFDDNLTPFLIAIYKHSKDNLSDTPVDTELFYILKNPTQRDNIKAKGAAIACIASIAFEAYSLHEERARIVTLATGTAAKNFFFKNNFAIANPNICCFHLNPFFLKTLLERVEQPGHLELSRIEALAVNTLDATVDVNFHIPPKPTNDAAEEEAQALIKNISSCCICS